ncbi:MAG: hypothetical protein FJW23_05885 [Acidimicrobiia bacterium]|nr:hypothetical protein [Acidimicrobiia bacterium]
MSTIEERVAHLEGRVQDHTLLYNDLRTSLAEFRAEMRQQGDEFRTALHRQGEELRAEMRRQGEELRAEMSQLGDELRGEMRQLGGELRGEIRRLDDRIDRHFTWLVGLLMAGLFTVTGAVVGLYFR